MAPKRKSGRHKPGDRPDRESGWKEYRERQVKKKKKKEEEKDRTEYNVNMSACLTNLPQVGTQLAHRQKTQT